MNVAAVFLYALLEQLVVYYGTEPSRISAVGISRTRQSMVPVIGVPPASAVLMAETGVWGVSPPHAASTASSTVDADLMVTDGDRVVVHKELAAAATRYAIRAPFCQSLSCALA